MTLCVKMGIQLLQARMPALDRWEDLAVPILVLIEGSCFRKLPQHHFIPFLDRTSRVSGRFSCRFPFHKPSWPVVSFYITIYHYISRQFEDHSAQDAHVSPSHDSLGSGTRCSDEHCVWQPCCGPTTWESWWGLFRISSIKKNVILILPSKNHPQ